MTAQITAEDRYLIVAALRTTANLETYKAQNLTLLASASACAPAQRYEHKRSADALLSRAHYAHTLADRLTPAPFVPSPTITHAAQPENEETISP